MPKSVIEADDADHSEAALSKAASRFRVILFGAGKTMFAPPDQPALQILLQYRNLYEAATKNVHNQVAEGAAVTDKLFVLPLSILDKMWKLVHACMVEYNKSIHNKAKLIAAERLVILNKTPLPLTTVPNPGFSKVPDKCKESSACKESHTSSSFSSSSVSHAEPHIPEPIVLDPEVP